MASTVHSYFQNETRGAQHFGLNGVSLMWAGMHNMSFRTMEAVNLLQAEKGCSGGGVASREWVVVVVVGS